MKKHNMIWMLLGCVIPLLVILLLPAFGVKSNFTFFLFILLMFACHLFMMRGDNKTHEQSKTNKEEKRGHH